MREKIVRLYLRLAAALSKLQSPFLLGVRLYFGWQLVTSGWGKMHSIPHFTELFAGWGIPFPGLNAHFIAGLEFFGGILLMVGLGSRLIAFLMTCNMLVAYWTADREAFKSFFSDPDKFTAAAPFDILWMALIVLIFGAGFFSIDALLKRRLKEQA